MESSAPPAQLQSTAVSIFEKYYFTQYPDKPFVWSEPKDGFTVAPYDIVCEGELKELNSSSGAVHSPQHFIATKDYLIRCYVCVFLAAVAVPSEEKKNTFFEWKVL